MDDFMLLAAQAAVLQRQIKRADDLEAPQSSLTTHLGSLGVTAGLGTAAAGHVAKDWGDHQLNQAFKPKNWLGMIRGALRNPEGALRGAQSVVGARHYGSLLRRRGLMGAAAAAPLYLAGRYADSNAAYKANNPAEPAAQPTLQDMIQQQRAASPEAAPIPAAAAQPSSGGSLLSRLLRPGSSRSDALRSIQQAASDWWQQAKARYAGGR